jgi:hypothetical protein
VLQKSAQSIISTDIITTYSLDPDGVVVYLRSRGTKKDNTSIGRIVDHVVTNNSVLTAHTDPVMSVSLIFF